MGRKRYSPEQIITMLREAEVLLNQAVGGNRKGTNNGKGGKYPYRAPGKGPYREGRKSPCHLHFRALPVFSIAARGLGLSSASSDLIFCSDRTSPHR